MRRTRDHWQDLRYVVTGSRWPAVILAAGFFAFGVFVKDGSLSVKDSLRECLNDVRLTVREIDLVLPGDPGLVAGAFERLAHAANLCERGQALDARLVLHFVKEDLGG